MFNLIKLKTSHTLPKEKQATWQEICLWSLLGALSFLVLYGIRPLIVTDDRWILNTYVEKDVVQHYAGWLAFRWSPWQFPLGLFSKLSGGVLTYADALPWVSIIFKTLNPWLPKTFQFFGLYIFLAFMLQAIASGKLLKLFINHKLAVAFGVLLFIFSPIMVERAFRHTALASHYLILFALYFLFKSYHTQRMSLWYILLSALAIGIHPYFLPMLYAIMAMNVLFLLPFGAKTFFKNALVGMLSLVITISSGFAIGALGQSELGVAEGFGYFSMNLNALYNPSSASGLVWSSLLPISPQTLGNYDGFNYLGLGVLFALPIALLYAVQNAKTLLKKYWGILLVCVCVTLFALSNVITLHDRVLFSYWLPKRLLNIASIFRASARMFYPVYYLVLLSSVVAVCRLNKNKVLLFLVVALQLVDMKPLITAKQHSFSNAQITQTFAQNELYQSPLHQSLAENISTMLALDYLYDFKLAAWCAKNHVNCNVHFAASHFAGEDDEWLAFASNTQALYNGELARNSAFITRRKEVADDVLLKMPNRYNIYTLTTHYDTLVNVQAGWSTTYYIIVNQDVELNGEQYTPN